jgi:putative transposase
LYILKDETQLKVDSEIIWLGIAIVESETKNILAISISKERNMFVAHERFLSDIVNEFGQHHVSTDGGGTWCPQSCKFLKLKHHLHSSYEESIIGILCNTLKIEPKGLTITFHAKKEV